MNSVSLIYWYLTSTLTVFQLCRGEEHYFSYIVARNSISAISWRRTVFQLYRGGEQYFSYIVTENSISATSWRRTVFQLYRHGEQYFSYIMTENSISAISWRGTATISWRGTVFHIQNRLTRNKSCLMSNSDNRGFKGS